MVKRLSGTVLFLFMALFLVGAPALANEKPIFKLGFRALAEQIPEEVGDPLEIEHYGNNGDALQQTAHGLLVWRKADNWTAFTNGYRTWVNGPYGIRTRLNTERFDWEQDQKQLVSVPATAEEAAEEHALSLINQHRQDRGLSPLRMDSSLRRLARAYASDMAARNFFAHMNPEGQLPWDRMRAAGIRYSAMAENLGWGLGYASPSESVSVNHQNMMAETPPDDGHRRNILDPNLGKVGIGVVSAADGKVYYACEFTD